MIFMQWLRRHIVNFFVVIFLTGIVGIVIVRNYVPGTLLTGIDNFHIEFDLSLALFRAWNGLWQENQGVGILSGLAQVTELSRIVIYWLISLIFPVTDIRYVYVFGNLWLGVLGAYFLTSYISKSKVAGMAASIYYLFNLNTIQTFFMPTEMFVVNYAALPWLFLLVIRYLNEARRVYLWWYLAALVLFAPMAMTPTIFVVYVLALSLLLFIVLVSDIKKWKQILLVGLVTLGASIYFLVPFGYFALNGSEVLREAKINQAFSVENYLLNASRNTFSDLVMIKGMWFDYTNYTDGKWQPLLSIWDGWLASKMSWIYGTFLLILTGMMVGVIKKNVWMISVSLIGIVSVLVLRGEAWPLGWVTSKIREIPLLAEAFRTPFTKFAPIVALSYSVLFGVCISFFVLWIKNNSIRKYVGACLLVVVFLQRLNLFWPIFGGHFFEERVRLRFPDDYFELFRFMNNEENGRIALLPAPMAVGWTETSWGYLGSGYWWYGIKQPIVDQAFHVWSLYNEGFYNELSHALYNNDKVSIEKVINKYRVKYVLIDESVLVPGQGREILRMEETKKLAEELGWEMIFNEGFLSVWDVDNSQITSDKFSNGKQWISVPETYTLAEVDTTKVREDVIFDELGTYVEYPVRPDLVGFNKDLQPIRLDLESQGAVIFPFAQLMREEVKNVGWGGEGVTISASVPSNTESRELVVPGWEVGEIVRVDFTENGVAIPAYTVNGQIGPVFLGKERPTDGKNYFFAKVSEGEEWREYREIRNYQLPSEKLEIEVKGEPFVYDFVKQGQGSIGNCDILMRGVATKDGGKYTADSRGAVCDYIVMEAPFTRVPYLLRLRGENVEGRSIKFFLWNTGSKRNDIEYLLGKGKFDQTFVLLPWAWDGYYTLNIETRSFGQRAENRMDPVVGMYVPLEKIARARINTAEQLHNNLEVTYVKKTGTWLYGLGVKGHGLIRLSQGYDEGWVGLHIGDWSWKNPFGFAQGLRHVKVDGWANGWIVEGNNERITDNLVVIVFYWPQLLQYIGFVVLGITIVGLIIPRHKS